MSDSRPLALALALLLSASGCTAPTPPRAAAPPTAPPPREPLVTETIAAPASPASTVLSSEPWTLESPDGRLLQTRSFSIYTTTTRRPLPERLPAFLELALAHYRSSLGDLPEPPTKLEAYIMANRPQWARMTQRLMGEQAPIYLRIERGGFTAAGRAVLWDIGIRDTFAIAAHEGWHLYTQRTFRNPLPVSFEEGLATYMEGFRWDRASPTGLPTFTPWSNVERFDQLRTAERSGRLLTLPQLLQSTPQELMANDPGAALTYYAQVWAFIHFLNEGAGGRRRPTLRTLLSDAARGQLLPRIQRELGGRAAAAYANRRTGIDLLELYFGQSTADLDAEYQEFIRQIVRVGSKERIVTGRSPITPGV